MSSQTSPEILLNATEMKLLWLWVCLCLQGNKQNAGTGVRAQTYHHLLMKQADQLPSTAILLCHTSTHILKKAYLKPLNVLLYLHLVVHGTG